MGNSGIAASVSWTDSPAISASRGRRLTVPSDAGTQGLFRETDQPPIGKPSSARPRIT
jgi:hypothetical protein